MADTPAATSTSSTTSTSSSSSSTVGGAAAAGIVDEHVADDGSGAVRSVWSEYHHLEDEWQRLEEMPVPSNSAELQTPLRATLLALQRLARRIDQADLYSTNEEADDLGTQALRFIMIPYLMALMRLKLFCPRAADRVENIKIASRLLDIFLTRCEQYQLFNSEDLKEYRRELPADPATKRQELIARRRREKAAEEKMGELYRRRHMKLAVIEAKGGDPESEADDELDEVERTLCLLQIEKASRDAVNQLRLCGEELPLAQMRVSREADDQQRRDQERPREAETASTRVDIGASSVAAAGNSQRDQLRAGVFRPDWRQPTMTVEEAIDLDIKMGAIKMTKGGTQPAPEEADPDQQDDDAVARKARNWDDWKDDNPRGAGNRYRQG